MRIFFVILLARSIPGALGACCALPEDTRTCDGKFRCCPGLTPDASGNCVPCAPGFYCADGQQSVPCPAGTFNDKPRGEDASWCLPQSSRCAAGEYISAAPTPASNVTCSRCKANCSNKQFMQGSCGGSAAEDEVRCVGCQACPSGFYHSPPCDGSRAFESECVWCTIGGCPAGQYRGPCGGGLDGACLPCTACPSGKYNRGCGGNSDGNCTECTVCGVGYAKYRECSALEDAGCKGGACNTTVSCGGLFCNYPAVDVAGCEWKWTTEKSQVNFLCRTSATQGTCQECPPGWTASGAYCVECRQGQSCDRYGSPRCDGACAAGKSPTCEPSTGRSVCSPCALNQTWLALAHRRVTRGGVLDEPGLCDAYFECGVGYYLTSGASQTEVTCERCAFPEPSQAGWELVSRGLTFGDVYGCVYRPAPPPKTSWNEVGQYGPPMRSCPPGYTSEAGMAPAESGCVPCPNAPEHGGFTLFDCSPACNSGYERRGELCALADRGRVVCSGLDGYGPSCSPSALPWSEPGSAADPGGGTRFTLAVHAGGLALAALDGASGYRATLDRLLSPEGGNPCGGLQTSVDNGGYVQDKPLFGFVCYEREMHTFYMVMQGSGVFYAFLERTFGNNNRFVMWQVQSEGAYAGLITRRWRLPGKVCSAAWSSLGGEAYVYLAFCKAPFLSFVRTSEARSVEKTEVQAFAVGKRAEVLIGRDEVGRADGMRDAALFGSSLSVANTSDPRRLIVADRDNCRLAEVVIDSPGSFLTRVSTIGQASCYSGASPTPFPRGLVAVLGGSAFLFVTDLGLSQMDALTRTVQLAVPLAELPIPEPQWVYAGEGGSVVYAANATHVAAIRRVQTPCPARSESARGGACSPCRETAYVTNLGRCAECSQPACELGRERLVPCGDAEDARCEACAAPASPPPYASYTFDANCSVVPAPPCPDGYYDGGGGGACSACPAMWSATEAYAGVPQSGVCQCFSKKGAAGALLDANGTCRIDSPFGAAAGPYYSPEWARGLNCTFEDAGCRQRGCYLQSAFPRRCAECAAGLYGANGMWCERCPGFREPSPAGDSCLCRAPSSVAEDGTEACVCPAGHAEGGPVGCTPCLPGTFKPGVTVMAEDYLAQAGACQPCPAGMESDAGASSCRACPAGLFRGAGAAGACARCASPNLYAADARDPGSCVECREACAEGQLWAECPVNASLYACSACADPLYSTRSWVRGRDNKNCMWECKAGFYELNLNCWPCARAGCEPGFVFTPCSRYEDGHCRQPCVNATKPDENAVWGAGCTWECAPGYALREKVLPGWTEYACELDAVLPWSGWW